MVGYSGFIPESYILGDDSGVIAVLKRRGEEVAQIAEDIDRKEKRF